MQDVDSPVEDDVDVSKFVGVTVEVWGELADDSEFETVEVSEEVPVEQSVIPRHLL